MKPRDPEPIVVRKQIFLSEAEVKFRITQERIRELLSQEFGQFSPENIPLYEERLAYIASQTQMKVNDLSYKDYKFIPNEKCPMCGARIYYDGNWNNRIAKTPGWRCEKGGLLHHLQYRANIMMKRQGQEPYFKEVVNA